MKFESGSKKNFLPQISDEFFFHLSFALNKHSCSSDPRDLTFYFILAPFLVEKFPPFLPRPRKIMGLVRTAKMINFIVLIAVKCIVTRSPVGANEFFVDRRNFQFGCFYPFRRFFCTLVASNFGNCELNFFADFDCDDLRDLFFFVEILKFFYNCNF